MRLRESCRMWGTTPLATLRYRDVGRSDRWEQSHFAEHVRRSADFVDALRLTSWTSPPARSTRRLIPVSRDRFARTSGDTSHRFVSGACWPKPPKGRHHRLRYLNSVWNSADSLIFLNEGSVRIRSRMGSPAARACCNACIAAFAARLSNSGFDSAFAERES